jgi:hypothetical protein
MNDDKEEILESIISSVSSTGNDVNNIIYDGVEYGEPTIEVKEKRLDSLLSEVADCKRMLQELLDQENKKKKTLRRKLGESLESK